MGKREVRRGKGAETRIAKVLSSTIGLRFARTPGSGSQHTAKFFEGKRVRGDVVCLDDPDFEFLIESKKTAKDFPWDLLLSDRPPADFEAWWAKTKSDATADSKFAALVISRNQGPMVMFTSSIPWRVLGMDPKYATCRLLYRNKLLMVTTVEKFGVAYRERTRKRG